MNSKDHIWSLVVSDPGFGSMECIVCGGDRASVSEYPKQNFYVTATVSGYSFGGYSCLDVLDSRTCGDDVKNKVTALKESLAHQNFIMSQGPCVDDKIDAVIAMTDSLLSLGLFTAMNAIFSRLSDETFIKSSNAAVCYALISSTSRASNNDLPKREVFISTFAKIFPEDYLRLFVVPDFGG